MDSFSSLMEFAVAIAGFSGITMAVQARSTVLSEVQSFRNTNLINSSLAAAFGSVIPQACSHLGASESEIWSWSSGLFALMPFMQIVLPFIARNSISTDGRRQLSRTIWILSIGGALILITSLTTNALGGFGEPGPAPLYLAILWHIFLASLMYARMLFGLRQSPDA